MKTSIQENQCFLAELMAGNVGIYTIREQWKLSNEVDACRLKDAFFYVVKSSSNLNRVFYFDDNSVLNSKLVDLPPLWNTDDIEFNMLEAPLICAGIYEDNDQKFFKIQFHHSLMDGWSLGLFMKDLQKAYDQKTISFVNISKNCTNEIGDFVPCHRDWKEYNFLSPPVGPESEGILLSLNNDVVGSLKKEASSNGTTLFPLIIGKISKAIFEISKSTSIEYAIPFSARNNSNINDIGMFVDTQLLELDTALPTEIQNKLLELISNPNPIHKYSGSPKIMLNFLDMNILKFALSDERYPISYVSKYGLFDLQLEFRNMSDKIDVSIVNRKGALLIERNVFYQKIKEALCGEVK
ncbi:hypothetical protein FACS1894122_02690 [Alphaproteobacteria bacterium]|nr:hypothetical protein FACS1894122_02690 [Alphaproteobacteria bacterium]